MKKRPSSQKSQETEYSSFGVEQACTVTTSQPLKTLFQVSYQSLGLLMVQLALLASNCWSLAITHKGDILMYREIKSLQVRGLFSDFYYILNGTLATSNRPYLSQND